MSSLQLLESVVDSPLQPSPTAAMPAQLSLVLRDVCVRVKEKAILKSVNGFVNSGEMLALIGASGCGKVCACGAHAAL
jgi:ABC-type transport system involved in cytochrome bd biosynthesis fused ATPase/permease subunit